MYDRHEGCKSRMKAKSALEPVMHRLLCRTGGKSQPDDKAHTSTHYLT